MKTAPTKDDIDKAFIWLYEHPSRVKSLMDDSVALVAPSGSDCSHPELWKGRHWRWLHSAEAIV